MFLAKALFDNVAEIPEELAFRRGDVITVMEEHADHVPSGWWLCSFQGRQGLAPANRLKILSGLLRTEETNQVSKDQMGQERTKTTSKLYKHSNDCQQDYDVPPSRYTPSRTQSPAPTASPLYDIPSHKPAPSRTSFNTRNLPAVHTHTRDCLYDNPPSSRRSSMERRLQRRSLASVDSLLSTSFQSLSADPHQKSLHRMPANRKRWSADCGSLMLLEKDNTRLCRRDSDNWRLSGETLAECHSGIPPVSQRNSLRNMLPKEQAVYSIPSSCNPVEVAGETTYDTPNPFTNRPHVNTGPPIPRKGLSAASSESCISVSSSHLASSRRNVVSDASLSESGLSTAGASPQGTRRLSSRRSCPPHWLSSNPECERLYDIPAACSQSPSRTSAPTPLADGITRDGSHEGLKTKHSLQPHSFFRNNQSEMGLKDGKSDPGHASAVCYNPDPIYDNPPQMTRHSLTSADSNSSGESNRLSSCSMDSFSSGAEYYCLVEGMYEELHLDPNSAIQLLIKLQGDVTKSASRVLMFVSSTWRTEEFLQSNLHEIKTACTELKNTMTQFVEFAQRTLVNSTHLSDRKLVCRLIKQVDHLQKQLKGLNEALDCLDDMKWQVTMLVESVKPDQEDPLDRIICLAQHLTPDVKKLVSLIHGNSSLLFKRSSEATELSEGSETVRVTSSPRRRRKVEPRSTSVQLRPLPPLPKSAYDKQALLAPAQQISPCQQVTDSQNNLNDKVSVMEEDMRRCTVAANDNDCDRDYSDLQGDYDYVTLETCDSAAPEKSKVWQDHLSEQKKHVLKNIDEEVELSDILTTDKNRNFVAMEQITEKDTCSKIMTNPVHHTEKMFADLGDEKRPDVHKARANQNTFKMISACKDNHKDHFKSHPQDLRTPVCTMNGSINPIRKPPSGTVGVTSPPLDPGDNQVLCYYSGQVETQCTLLINAIDTFISCVQDHEPPEVFISNSKFVIVTAYKLIYIGNALHRRLVNVELRERVMRCAGQVCECLRVCVQATKTAALQFPSVTAIQHMMDRVVDVSHAAHELRLVITQASSS